MLSRTVGPKTKGELIAALQRASIKSVEVYEGDEAAKLGTCLKRWPIGATVIVVR
jgi:hypothetical protein